jgi:nucleotide-binding universal stress UspA family protein
MKFLIPVDGSDLSLQAVRQALAWVGQGLRAELVLVNVQEPATVYELVTLHDADALAELAQAAGADVLAPALQMVRLADVVHQTVVVSGDPVPMLLEVLEEQQCHAVVMGSHGKGAVSSALLGSVSQAMLAASPVPVVFVKPPPEPETT